MNACYRTVIELGMVQVRVSGWLWWDQLVVGLVGGRVTSALDARLNITCHTLTTKPTTVQPAPMSSSINPPIPTDGSEISRAPPSQPPSPPRPDPSNTSNTTAPEQAAATTTDPQGTTKLSKNARKRQLKAKRWEETREAWKAAKREKKKVRKAAERVKAKAAAEAAREATGESEKQEDGADGSGNKNNGSMNRRRPVLEPITLIMDCGFDDLMSDKVFIPFYFYFTLTHLS